MIAEIARRVAAVVTGPPLSVAADLSGLAVDAGAALAVVTRRGLGRAASR